MKKTPFYSNFTAGELSNKYTGRVDDSLYYKGARTMENMRPMAQGGFKSTGGSWYSISLPNEEFRIIPFVISETLQYLLCLGRSQLRAHAVNPDGSLGAADIYSYGLTYSEKQLFEVQFCQNYNELFITHKLHKPRVFTYTGAGFTYGDLTIITNAGEPVPFQIPDEYPGSCAFFAGRLFLAGTVGKPQGVWASMPFEPGNFTKFETIEETRTELTDPATWADPEVPESTEIITSRDIIGDAHSLHFEIASDQNDGIVWMAAGTELVLGTITSEWVVPDDITANDITAKMKTRYGSPRIQARMVGGHIIMLQRGGKKIREYKEDEDSLDLSFTADHITGSGIIQYDAAKVPDPLIYFVRADGDIAVLMYNKPHDVQGWYRLKSASGAYESVACVTSETGDYVYAVVSSGSARWIERLDDEALTQMCEGVMVTGGAGSVSANLQGREIQLWGPGGQEIVTAAPDGSFACSLPNGDYTAGLGFASILETMSIEIETELGTSQLKTRRINEVSTRVLEGGHFRVGYSSDPSSLETVTDTGLVRIPYRGGSEKDASIHMRRDQPYPLMVSIIIPEIEVNEL